MPSIVPAAVPVTSAAPAPAAPAISPIIAKPVETAPIGSIDPQSIGLIGGNDNGLGATMWKGTPRAFVEKLLPAVALPTTSSALNNLAKRFLLTTASVPEGAATAGAQNLVSMRVAKLVALGDADNAWKLALQAKPDQIDDDTLRLTVEAGLISNVREDICAKLPDIIKTHTGAEWQKSMLICQLRAKDTKAAQLTLDLLHTQNVKDDIFFYIAEKNIIGTNKQLPRQLTPLKPLTLALIRMTDLPVPGEVYARPEAALIPELLQSRAREDGARVALAERAAERGYLNDEGLAAVYKSVSFTPEAIAAGVSSAESGARLHALLYQAAAQDKTLKGRMGDVARFMQTSSAALLNKSGDVLLEMLGDVPMTDEANIYSATITHLYILAGKPDKALEWMKQAKHAAIGMPQVANELLGFWPETVLAGLESDADFPADLGKWLDQFLKKADSKTDERHVREQAASVLLLLEAAGFPVAEEQWTKVVDTGLADKRISPPVLLFERLRTVAAAGHRGESVLISLALAGDAETPLLSTIEIVHALKQVGLTADTAALAREAVMAIITPSPARP